MAGVLVGASTAGILGALLATPVLASGREIVRFVHGKLLEQEPGPDVNRAAESAPRRAAATGRKIRTRVPRRKTTGRPSSEKPAEGRT